MTKINEPKQSDMSDLSPASKYEKLTKVINLLKKHKQFNKE
jgi:hypothetical protein